MAAPVGVTRSPGTPSSIVSRPSRSSAVAGAGIGRGPWAVVTRLLRMRSTRPVTHHTFTSSTDATASVQAGYFRSVYSRTPKSQSIGIRP